MDKLRCAAIDDEPFALELLSDDIDKIPFLELTSTFLNPSDAHEIIDSGKIDLLFLDIEMPGMNGVDFVRNLKKAPLIIFTTAYDRYALEGFELNVVDYLLKPVPFDRFLQAAERANTLHELFLKNEEFSDQDFFFVHVEYQKIKIFRKDILYVEGLKDYVKIYTASRPKPVLTRVNLKKMESILASGRFCRVHQSFIISLDKITSAQKKKVFVNSRQIPVGEKYASEFQGRYQ